MTDTNGAGETEVIKLDRLGRSRYTKEYRIQVLDAFERSELTGQAFARHCGVKYQTLATWVQKRKKATRSELEANALPAAPSFLLAELRDESSPAGLKVSLPGGAVLYASSHEQVPLLVELLKALCPERC
jgi:transposase-like protein